VQRPIGRKRADHTPTPRAPAFLQPLAHPRPPLCPPPKPPCLVANSSPRMLTPLPSYPRINTPGSPAWSRTVFQHAFPISLPPPSPPTPSPPQARLFGREQLLPHGLFPLERQFRLMHLVAQLGLEAADLGPSAVSERLQLGAGGGLYREEGAGGQGRKGLELHSVLSEGCAVGCWRDTCGTTKQLEVHCGYNAAAAACLHERPPLDVFASRPASPPASTRGTSV
jgi:hypothetical protein